MSVCSVTLGGGSFSSSLPLSPRTAQQVRDLPDEIRKLVVITHLVWKLPQLGSDYDARWQVDCQHRVNVLARELLEAGYLRCENLAETFSEDQPS